MDQSPEPTFTLWRRWRIGLHAAVSILAMLSIAVMVNYIAHRHNARFYVSSASRQNLSPLTLQVLKSLTKNVKVIVFFDRHDSLFNSVAAMIKEYGARSPKLQIEFVDYRMPGRAEAIRKQYELTSGSDSSRVIFDANGQVRTVLGSELSDYQVAKGKEFRRSGFRGEQMFTSALLNLTQVKPATAYFSQGHGEGNPNSTEDRGYSLFARLLLNNNITVKPLPPLIGKEIPQDCSLLIITDPQTTFDPEELTKIERYLSQGGRLLMMFSVSSMGKLTGLERMLWGLNVEVGFNMVKDTSQEQAEQTGVLVTSEFGAHPITRPLLRSSLKLIFPRSIAQRQTPVTTADAPKIVELASTTKNGQTLIPRPGNVYVVQPPGERVVPLMVAWEKGAITGIAAEKGTARAVITGDALFLANLAFNQAANADFANLAVNWLLNRDSLLNEIGPSPVTEYEILLTHRQLKRLRWIMLVITPGTVLAIGFLVWIRRRA